MCNLKRDTHTGYILGSCLSSLFLTLGKSQITIMRVMMMVVVVLVRMMTVVMVTVMMTPTVTVMLQDRH